MSYNIAGRFKQMWRRRTQAPFNFNRVGVDVSDSCGSDSLTHVGQLIDTCHDMCQSAPTCVSPNRVNDQSVIGRASGIVCYEPHRDVM